MIKYIVAMIKFTDYPDDFKNGLLFCNTWEYFDQLEKTGIGDSSELSVAISKWEFKNFITGISKKIRYVDSSLIYTPVFCMTACFTNSRKTPSEINYPSIKLDDVAAYKSALIITDVKKFLQRINQYQPNFCYSPMNYELFSDEPGTTYFNPIVNNKNFKKYGHQKEFRLYNHRVAITRDVNFHEIGITNISGNYYNDTLAHKFPTTSLRDIVKEVSINELLLGVKVDLKIDWDFCEISNLVKVI